MSYDQFWLRISETNRCHVATSLMGCDLVHLPDLSKHSAETQPNFLGSASPQERTAQRIRVRRNKRRRKRVSDH